MRPPHRPTRKRTTTKRRQRAPWPFELPEHEVVDDVDVEGPGADPKPA
jgi:hypothetical protein